MRARTVVAFLGGMFPIAVGYVFAPSPNTVPGLFSSEEDCGLDSVFPVTVPSLPLDCYDCDGCTFHAGRAVITMLVLGTLSLLSGIFNVRISKEDSTPRAIIPAGIANAFFLVLMAVGRDFLLWPTLLTGVAALVCSIALAAAGARLAVGDA